MLPFVLVLLLMCSVEVQLINVGRLNTQVKDLMAQDILRFGRILEAHLSRMIHDGRLNMQVKENLMFAHDILRLERILEDEPVTGDAVTIHTPDAYNYQYLHDLGVVVTDRKSVIFSVQACNDAHVALSNMKDVDTDRTVEIVIGGWANSQSVIRACKQCYNRVTYRSRPLQCGAQVNFWVSWENNDIRVGTGHSVGEDEFMTWHNPANYDINYVAVSTGWGSTGDWTFPPAVPESPVTIHTPDAYHYQYLHDIGVDVTENTSIIFSVQACNDAHVALSNMKDVDTDWTVEIVIGGWANSQSVIRACKQCYNEVTYRSSPLRCDAKVTFWVSWKDNDIRVGTGHSVGEDEFMTWHNPADYDINYVAVSTGWGSTGDWIFPPEHHPCEANWHNVADKCVKISDDELTGTDAKGRCEAMGGQLAHMNDTDTQSAIAELVTVNDGLPGSPVTLHTPDAYNYEYLHDLGVDITERTSIIFSVQACNDAHVALSSVKDVDIDWTTEIVIGGWGNSQSVIRACKQCHNEDTHRSRPLQCGVQVQFWVSWKDNDIRVGTGHSVEENEFMSWHNPANYDINYVAVSTGWGSTGDWTFPSTIPGTIHTPDAYNYQYLHNLGVDVTENTSIIFSVQACNDAHVALSSMKDVDTDRMTEIVIGGWSNSQSVIRACKQCHNEVTYRSSPLRCDAMVPFWVSWKGNDIRVGTGHSVGEDEFMSWHNPANYDINYVAVSTGWGSTGDWTFPLDVNIPREFWVYQNADSADGSCMVVDMNNDFLIRADDCNVERHYICERPTGRLQQNH